VRLVGQPFEHAARLGLVGLREEHRKLIATGSTANAACQVVLAVPVAPHDWTDRLDGVADELISVSNPQRFSAVGQCSRDFTQTSNDEVTDCLDLLTTEEEHDRDIPRVQRRIGTCPGRDLNPYST
jgi:hypothetical protein